MGQQAENSTSSETPQRRDLGRRAVTAAAITAGVMSWEYFLNGVMNPDVAWSTSGAAAHLGLDLLLMLPVVLLARAGARRWTRSFEGEGGDGASLLGETGFAVLLFLLLAVPVTSVRDVPHEILGQRYGVALAEAQTTSVGSDLTVTETTQLCSLGAVRNPALLDDGLELMTVAKIRLRSGVRDVLVELSALLPLLLLAGAYDRRRHWSGWSFAPFWALTETRTLRLGSLALTGGFLVFCAHLGFGDGSEGVALATTTLPRADACTDGGTVREYSVHAIDVTMTLNRWGDHVEDTHMYALEANIPKIRAFEAALDANRQLDEVPGDPNAVTRVSAGLRKDPIQPLVLRANLGECLKVHFTNDLEDGDPASLHILGLPHSATSAGSAVGNNPDTFAAPGETITYEIPIPDDPQAERAYYFHDHGAGRRRQNMGLFGAIVAEPKGARYLDVETGEELDTITGSNWEAIIVDPNVDERADGKSFREFVIFYHEIGDEAFTAIRDRDGKKLPLVDDVAGVYRPAARALNYRSEPFRRRIEADKLANGENAGDGKSLGYASYPFGDPATPIPRSYVGEGVKTRLLHGGSEVFHVHHLHGGGDRWRRNPDADQASDFWKGLTKVPDPNLASIHLDSQSIGPGTSYNLEHECGAGGCQQGVGEFLYHCHIGHHYISGMWSFWRVFGTEQTAEINVNGHPLATIPELFQTESLFQQSTMPESGVSAGELLGLEVDGGRILGTGVTDDTTKNLREWISEMLPPSGVPFDNHDATVWDWTFDGAGADMRVLGEPESTTAFPGYVPRNPGQRPEVLFNPKNGRYTWPLFRPHLAQRPPFTARHSGAPWLGEEMDEGRLDGLCATPELVPEIGPGAVKRYYPLSAITLPIPVTSDREDPDGQIFVLNEEREDVEEGRKAAEPLAIRSNVGDCVELVFTNRIPDSPLNKGYSKANIHSHFVQFDTQASDGVITGFSYEQSVRPYQTEERWLTSSAPAGTDQIAVNHTQRLREGIWLGIGLGEGVCGETEQGQPRPCTEIRQIVDLGEQSITLDRPLDLDHTAAEAVGVEFVRYNWFSDVDFGTVFFHTHVEFKDWDHGLFGTHIVEPKGSTYHDPLSGEPVRSGTLVDIHVDPTAGGNAVSPDVDGSFREFMLFLHNNNPVEGQFVRGGGTINLRAEPWRLRREGDPAYRFSSVTHGDPWTPLVRAYVGDPVVVRGMGLVERVGGIRFTGHRFHQERTSLASDTRDSTYIGISERFDVSLEGGAGGPGGFPGDYLYYSTLGRDFESGGWGILRVHDTEQGDLQPLPGREPASGAGFPQLSFTGDAPPASQGAGASCPAEAPRREYQITIADTEIVYNDTTIGQVDGVSYRQTGLPSSSARTPLVLRANAGDCLVLKVRNQRDVRSSLSVGELVADPQHSYGSAIGFNHDSTIPPGSGRRVEVFADREVGTVLGLNLGDIDAVSRGAYAAIVIEPEGAAYYRPGTDEPLPGGGFGIQADIVTEGVRTREFVALFADQDRRIGQSAMPYPVEIENFNGINYANEPLRLRGMDNAPSKVFDSSLWGDPRYVVSVPAGTPLIYRVAQPWGDQVHVPTLEGHRWVMEPGMEGSEQMYADVLAPGMSLDLHFVGGAGSDARSPGDYLFLDRRQPFLEGGLWNLLRVTESGDDSGVLQARGSQGPGKDRVRFEARPSESGSGWTLEGVVGLRPAGDTAEAVTVYQGAELDGRCTGRKLGRAEVDPGSGRWVLDGVSNKLSQICVASAAGGVSSKAVAR